MYSSRDWNTAVHEAGHAVSRWELGGTIEWIAIRLNGCLAGEPDLVPIHEYCTLWAAEFAENLYGKIEYDVDGKATVACDVGNDEDSDGARMSALLAEIHKSDGVSYEQIQRIARATVKAVFERPHVKPGFLALVQRLVEVGRLTGDEAMKCYRAAQPPP